MSKFFEYKTRMEELIKKEFDNKRDDKKLFSNYSYIDLNNWYENGITQEMKKEIEKMKKRAMDMLLTTDPDNVLFYQAEYKALDYILNLIEKTKIQEEVE